MGVALFGAGPLERVCVFLLTRAEGVLACGREYTHGNVSVWLIRNCGHIQTTLPFVFENSSCINGTSVFLM